jgi:hypothetical protein
MSDNAIYINQSDRDKGGKPKSAHHGLTDPVEAYAR